MSLLYRWKLAIALAESSQTEQLGVEAPLTIDLVGQTPADQRHPVRLVAFWAERLMPGRTLDPTLTASLAQALASDLPAGEPLDEETLAGRLPQLVALLLMSPDFNVR